jgi:threonine/homoserine/homoserine lactone efflux protein
VINTLLPFYITKANRVKKMTFYLLLAYCSAIFIASIIPGPSMFLALLQGSEYGIFAGFIGAIGNVIASLVQAVITYYIIIKIGGISSSIFFWLKIFGAVYIIYVGVKLLPIKNFAKPSDGNIQRSESIIRHGIDGFLFAILNPKALTFFAALFPKFVHPGAIEWAVILAVFMPIAIIAFVCFMAYVVAGSNLIKIFNSTIHIGKIFGIFIISSGIILLFS